MSKTAKQTAVAEELEEETTAVEAPEPSEVTSQVVTPAAREVRPIAIEQTSSETHPLVKMVMDSGPLDTTSLGDLLKLQRDWEAAEAKKAFTRAMVEMKRELPTVLSRDKRVDFEMKAGGRTTYTHLSLAAAVEAITPHVCKHGFSVAFGTRTLERNYIEVACTITHHAGHSENCVLSAPPETSGTKHAVQAVASTVTLLQRYTLLSLLGIATKDHTDPEPRGEPVAAMTADEILAAFKSAKVPEDVAKATKARNAIASTLSEQDAAELGIERSKAIARIKGGRS